MQVIEIIMYVWTLVATYLAGKYYLKSIELQAKGDELFSTHEYVRQVSRRLLEDEEFYQRMKETAAEFKSKKS